MQNRVLPAEVCLEGQSRDSHGRALGRLGESTGCACESRLGFQDRRRHREGHRPPPKTRGATASRASGCSPPSCLATWARAQLAVRLHAEIPTDEISRGRRQHPDVRRSVNGRAALGVGARGRRWGRTASMVPHPGPVACRDARLGEEPVLLGSHHPHGRMAGAFTRRSRPFPAGTPSRSCPQRVHVPRSPGRCSENLNDGIELRAVAVPVEREAAAAAVSAGRAC